MIFHGENTSGGAGPLQESFCPLDGLFLSDNVGFRTGGNLPEDEPRVPQEAGLARQIEEKQIVSKEERS